MQCKFASMCKYHQEGGHTCKRDSEAKEHCGVYALFKECAEQKNILNIALG